VFVLGEGRGRGGGSRGVFCSVYILESQNELKLEYLVSLIYFVSFINIPSPPQIQTLDNTSSQYLVSLIYEYLVSLIYVVSFIYVMKWFPIFVFGEGRGGASRGAFCRGVYPRASERVVT